MINLTTLAVPDAPFLNANVGISGDTETTGQLGYDYYGSSTDWTGYDNGARDVRRRAVVIPRQRRAASAPAPSMPARSPRHFVTPDNGLVQRTDKCPSNFSGSLTGGTSWEIGDSRARPDRHRRLQQQMAHPRQQPSRPRATPTCRRRQGLPQRRHREPHRRQRAAGPGLRIRRRQSRALDQPLHPRHAQARQPRRPACRTTSAPARTSASRAPAWYERQLVNTQLNGAFKLGPTSRSTPAPRTPSRSRDAPVRAEPRLRALQPGGRARSAATSSTASTTARPASRTSRSRTWTRSSGPPASTCRGASCSSIVLTGWRTTSPTRSATPPGASSRSSRRRASRAPSRCCGPTTCSARRSSTSTTSAWSRPPSRTRPSRPSCAPAPPTCSCRPSCCEGLELNAGARFETAKQDVQPDPGVHHADQLRRLDQPRQRLRAARGDADLEVPGRHAAALQRLEDHRAPAVPRADVPGATSTRRATAPTAATRC